MSPSSLPKTLRNYPSRLVDSKHVKFGCIGLPQNSCIWNKGLTAGSHDFGGAMLEHLQKRLSQKKITDAQVVEMVWRHSQCVLNQTGRCPLPVFGKQLADEVNAYFNEEE